MINTASPADPLLTPLGKEQAEAIRVEWSKEAGVGLPPPHRRYCSPLSRALDTCDIMFDRVYKEYPDSVLVVEVSHVYPLQRETLIGSKELP